MIGAVLCSFDGESGAVTVCFKAPIRGEIAHLVIDSTGLKAFGEGEWKVRKHGKERSRIWRKLHLAVELTDVSGTVNFPANFPGI